MRIKKAGLIVWTACLVAFSTAEAGQVQITGVVKDELNNGVETLVTAGPKETISTADRSANTDSNGVYSITVDVPASTVVTVSATRFGGYKWIRELNVGNNTTIPNVDLVIPTVNTNSVSLFGVVRVQGGQPQNVATVAVKTRTPINGQSLLVIRSVVIPGFSGNNSYKFFDLPPADYDLTAQADSSSWTQLVVSVNAANVPIELNLDF